MAVEMNRQEPKKITVSVIKADIGGWVGHSAIHPALIENANGGSSRRPKQAGYSWIIT